ncbi:MAG: pirin family protein, partial [Anaerolineaceae bacterium]
MSTEPVAGKEFNALGADRLTFTAHPGRDTRLGGLPILRAMPIRDRRMTGPWCFLDRYGPLAFSADRAMDVPPHPHIGIQTVSWLLEGEVQHADSLGCEAVVRPGGVNVMTAGNGISHAEVTPSTNSGRLNGVQLWVALPDEQRMMAPSFAHIEQVPVVQQRGGLIHVFAGSLGDTVSPAPHFSEIIGLDVQVHAGETTEFELNPAFEHAALLLEGECSFENQPLQPRVLYYFGTRRRSLAL